MRGEKVSAKLNVIIMVTAQIAIAPVTRRPLLKTKALYHFRRHRNERCDTTSLKVREDEILYSALPCPRGL